MGCDLAPEVMQLLLHSPAWQAHHGRDHIIVISTLISNMVSHARCFHFLFEFCKYCIKIGIEDTNSNFDIHSLNLGAIPSGDEGSWNVLSYISQHNSFLAVPYPSSIHLPPDMTWNKFYDLRYRNALSNDTSISNAQSSTVSSSSSKMKRREYNGSSVFERSL